MCGIAGYLQLDGSPAADPGLLRRMNAALVHRGPDDEGYLMDGPVALAMRRLSIIDLATGHQPVHNEDRTVWVVFNGEVYNYRDLGAELRAKGHTLYTSSDTETIVHLYEERGQEFVEPLRGMFALAIWDRRRQTLVLARDRLGVKPLYYSVHAGRLTFGSELKALLADPEAARGIDPRGLAAYLRYGYVPDPLTILPRVRKLPPGHLLVARGGRVEVRAYWDLLPFFQLEQRPRSEAECREQVAALLDEAVRLRLVSDVPLGAFLSGGIDSSTVVALMSRALDRPVRTFSVGFEEEALSELSYAREVARRLGTDHHELVLRPESLDLLGALVRHFDEPFGDPSALPTYFVARLARESVKVVLSGDGGDEVFGGYDRYLEHLRRGFADRLPALVRRGLLRPLSTLLAEGTPGKRLLYNLSLPPDARYLDSISYFAPPLLRRLLGPDVHAALARDADYLAHLSGLDAARPLTRIQLLDFKTYLPGDILVKVDRMTMAHSIEAREPLLDHKLVEYMAGLPPALKVRGETGKYLLKRIASASLPAHIVYRRKQGFAIPLERWFKDSLAEHVREVLGDPVTRQRGYLNPAGLDALMDGYARAPRRYVHRLWLLLIFEIWCRLYLDAARPGGFTAAPRDAAGWPGREPAPSGRTARIATEVGAVPSAPADLRARADNLEPHRGVWGRLLDALRRDASFGLPRREGFAGVELGRAERRLHCEIGELRARASTGWIHLVAKVLADPTASDAALVARARRELASIRRYRDLLAGSPFEPLRAVGDFSECRAIVTEKIPGEGLNDLIRRHAHIPCGPSSLAALARHCEKAGRWLRWVHARSHRATPNPRPARSVLDLLEGRIEACLPLGLALDLVGPTRVFARRVLERHPPATWPVVAAHNDFTPENILVTPRGLVVVDYQAAERLSTPYPDLAGFLAYLEAFAKYPAYRVRTLQALRSAFLEAYGRQGRWTSPDVLTLFEVIAMLSLYTYAASPGGRTGPLERLRRFALRRFVNGWLRRTLTAGPEDPRCPSLAHP